MLNVNEIRITSATAIAEFNSYYATIGSKLDQIFSSGSVVSDHFQSLSMPQKFSFQPIEVSSIAKQLSSLQSKKASGLDNIPSRLLKVAAHSLAPSITYLFNLSLSNGVFPSEWKMAKVSPLCKYDARVNVGNYHPISILPIIGKIFEKEVHKQLYQYLLSNDFFHPCQHGFRANRSTQTALIKVTDEWLSNMDKVLVTGVVFLELAKAFDAVKHDFLIDKFQFLGINGKELDWFTSYLRNRYQCVYYNETLSSPHLIDIGVPQGSVLGHLLFLIYVNSSPSCVQNSLLNMFADDTAIYYSGSTTQEVAVSLTPIL